MTTGRNSRWQALLPWALPILLLVIWEVSVASGLLSTRILPSLTAVLLAAWRLARSGELFSDIAISFGRAAGGFLIGGSLGFVLGLLNGISTLASKTLDSSLQMIRNIPHLALIPLVILWFGIDEEAKLFLVALGVFFPIYLNTYHGVRTVDAGLVEMGRVYGLSGSALLREIILQ